MFKFQQLGRRLGIVAGIVSLTVLGAAASASARAHSAATQLRAALVAMGQPAAECNTQCEYTSCTGDNHKNQGAGNGTNSGTVHVCNFSENGCQDHACDSFFNDAHIDLAKVDALLRTVSGSELQSLVGLNGRIRINWERKAAQLVGCGERIALSVNLTRAQEAALVNVH